MRTREKVIFTGHVPIMASDLLTWRARIGTFNSYKTRQTSIRKCPATWHIVKSEIIFLLSYLTHSGVQIFLDVIVLFLSIVSILSYFVLYYHTCTNYLWLVFPLFRLSFGKQVAIYPFVISGFFIKRSQVFWKQCKSPYTLWVLLMHSIFLWYSIFLLLLIISGNIHPNPGPKIHQQSRLSFACWNVDSLPARNFEKVPLIEAFQQFSNFDLFGICETYLNDEHSSNNIQINGFSDSPFRADCKRSNTHKQGGVLLYYKENLPIIERKDINTLEECIVCEIKLKNKKIFFVLLYRSPSQKLVADVDKFTGSLETLIRNMKNENPHAIIMSGDFNARSPLLWSQETREELPGKRIANIANIHNFEQLIDEPTHLPRGDIATCIDLIFTNQPFFFVDSGVHPSLDINCKHQIIYGKLNIETPTPPKYRRQVWDYPLASVFALRSEVAGTNWEQLFAGKNIDEITEEFTSTFLTIVSKHIPSKMIVFDDKDAPWVTPIVKTAIKRHRRVYRNWNRSGRVEIDWPNVAKVKKETALIIREAKKEHIKNSVENFVIHKQDKKNFGTHIKEWLIKKRIPIFLL